MLKRSQHIVPTNEENSATLPEGWCTARLLDVTVKVLNTKPEAVPERLFRYADISSIDNKRNEIVSLKSFRGKDAPSRARRPVQVGDVLFSNVRTYLRNIALVKEGTLPDVCSTGFTVLRTNGAVLPLYLLRYLLTRGFLGRISETQTGTHYPATSDRAVLSQTVPVPPLAEQERIVALIEPLLTQLGDVDEHLQRAPAILVRFRKSVLSAACSGKLTEEWRKSRKPSDSSSTESGGLDTSDLYELPDGWKWKRLGRHLKHIEAGKSFTCVEKPPSFKEIGVVKVSAVTWGRYDEDESKTCTDQTKVNPKLFIRKGDFLFSRANTIDLVGTCVIAEQVTNKVMLSDKILRFHFTDIRPEWILSVLRSPHGRSEIEQSATGNQQSMRNIGQERIRNIRIPCPPDDEQQEIVRRIDSLMKLADTVEERIQNVAKSASSLWESVLSKAFLGELVPTEALIASQENRTYESGCKLLVRLRDQGFHSAAKAKPLTRRVKRH